MGHKCKVRGRRTRPVSSPPHPRFRGLTSCCRVCPHLNLREVWSPQCAQCPTPLSRQELKRKLESAEDSDIVEQGKVTLKSVKKELRLLQKAEEEQNQGEGARSPPLCILLPLPTPVLLTRSVHQSPYAPTPQALSRPWSRGWARRTTRRWARSRSARSTLSRSSATETTRSSPPPASDKGPSMVRGERARGSEACAEKPNICVLVRFGDLAPWSRELCRYLHT